MEKNDFAELFKNFFKVSENNFLLDYVGISGMSNAVKNFDILI